MPNILSNMIPGAGGGSLTTSQQITLGYLRYDPMTDRLVSDKSFETLLESLYFGSLYSMSAGGSQIHWSNFLLREHTVPVLTRLGFNENGINWVDNTPKTRQYTKYDTIEAYGPLGDGQTVVDYAAEYPAIPVGLSDWGHAYVPAENYTGLLYYALHAEPTGEVLMDRQYQATLVAGQLHKEEFLHCLDIPFNQAVHYTLRKDDGEFLQVWSTDDGLAPYVKAFFRTYTDDALPLLAQLTALENAMGLTRDFDYVMKDGEFVIAANGEFIKWNNRPAPLAALELAMGSEPMYAGYLQGRDGEFITDKDDQFIIWGPQLEDADVHSVLWSPDGVTASLSLSDNGDLLFNNGTRNRLSVNSVNTYLVSPDGTNLLKVANSYTEIDKELRFKNDSGKATIQWWPDSGSRKGWFGYGSSGDYQLTLRNEVADENLVLDATGTGIVYSTSVFRAAGYKSSDGTVGMTGTFDVGTNVRIITKNGLVTGMS